MDERYPHNWKELATACKDRAGWQCEHCGTANWLTAAHTDHDLENPNPRLMCLCWPCHKRYDANTGKHHPGKIARRIATRKRTMSRKKEQLARSVLYLKYYVKQRQAQIQPEEDIPDEVTDEVIHTTEPIQPVERYRGERLLDSNKSYKNKVAPLPPGNFTG